MNAQSGIYTEICKAGGMDVCNIKNGDWIKIRGVDFGKKGAQKFSASVAGTVGNGQIELRVGDPSGTVIGTCKVASTGNEQTWKTISCKVNKVPGVQDLYLKFTGGEGKLFNFDWWQFSEK
jgi:arabinoxylan arabinofuranohydrolase